MRFRLVLLATTALVAATAPARAEPISAAIGLSTAIASTFGVTAATAGSIGGSIIGLGVSLGLSTLSQALSPKPKAGEANSGVETSVQIGGDVPRQIVVGRCAVKGQLVYQNTWGPENTFLDRIFVLSDWVSEGLASVLVNGVRKDLVLSASGPSFKYYTIAEYPDQIYIALWDGTQTEADPAYVASANPPGRWTADARLTGMTYAAVRFGYRKDVPLYENGDIPDLTFELDGAKLYDRRKDDTAGGAGPHRWDDPTTWEFSENCFVAIENYLRGFHAANGERLLGMGAPAYDLIAETFMAAANVCDETVTRDDGTTEPRYRCAAILTCDEDVAHRQVLDTLLSTCAGYLYDYGGSYFAQAGAAQSPVRTITDADLVVGAPVTFAAKRSRAELINRIHGQFLDPASGYQPQSYTARVSAADAAADGEELGQGLDLMAVPSQSQAERIAEIRRREARAQATASVTLGFDHVDLQVGDWITWASARFRTKTWRVVDREVAAATRAVTLNLAETGAAVFSWAAVQEGAPAVVPIRLQPGTRMTTVPNFSVEAVTITSDDGSTALPGIRAAWNTITDPSVDTVEIEYRIIGTATAQKATDATPRDGEHLISGVVNATGYEARANLRTTPSRATTWTAWIPVTTTDDFFFAVDLPHLAAQLRHDIEDATALREGTVRDALEKLRRDVVEELAAATATEAGQSYEHREIVKVALEGRVNEAFVAAISKIDLEISERSLLGETVQGLAGRLADPTTGLDATVSAIESVKVAIAYSEAGGTASSGKLTALESRIDNPTTGLGATSSAVENLATAVGLEGQGAEATSSFIRNLSAEVEAARAGSPSLGARISTVETISVTQEEARALVLSEVESSLGDVTAQGRRGSSAVVGADGATVILFDEVSREAGGVKVRGGRYTMIGPDGKVRDIVDADAFYVGKFDAAGNLIAALPALSVDTATGVVTIPNLVVTTSLIAPGSVFDRSKRQAPGNIILVINSAGQGVTPLMSADMTWTFSSDGPGTVMMVANLGLFVDGGGSATLYGGVDDAFEEIGTVNVNGSAVTNLSKVLMLDFAGAGSHTIRLAFSTATSTTSRVTAALTPGAKYDFVIFRQGTAA